MHVVTDIGIMYICCRNMIRQFGKCAWLTSYKVRDNLQRCVNMLCHMHAPKQRNKCKLAAADREMVAVLRLPTVHPLMLSLDCYGAPASCRPQVAVGGW